MAIADGAISEFAIGEFTPLATGDTVVTVGAVVSVAAALAPAVGSGAAVEVGSVGTITAGVAPRAGAGATVSAGVVETVVDALVPVLPPGAVVELVTIATVADAPAPRVGAGAAASAFNTTRIGVGSSIGELAIGQGEGFEDFTSPVVTVSTARVPDVGGGTAVTARWADAPIPYPIGGAESIGEFAIGESAPIVAVDLDVLPETVVIPHAPSAIARPRRPVVSIFTA
ncbi:hypothetical protein ACTZWW_04055 [Salinarimonas sp. NSM]|uniref:hypothetical protein n=1 Tax=Salinarimonas sp. NSM TaxID=3458003 RepID=UPI004036CD81